MPFSIASWRSWTLLMVRWKGAGTISTPYEGLAGPSFLILQYRFGTIITTSFPPVESGVAVALTAWVVKIDARLFVT